MSHMPTTDQPDGAPGVPNTRALNATAPVRIDGAASADLTADRTVSIAALGIDASLIAPDAVTTSKVVDNAITMAKLEDAPGARIIGAIAAGSPLYLTGTQLTTLIDLATSLLPGAMPPFSGDASTALLGDGSWGSIASGYLTPEQFGAVGDGNSPTPTDDRPAFVLAVAACTALNGLAALKLTAGKSYYVSESVRIDETVNFQLWGNNAEVIFPSDDQTLTTSSGELSAQQRRSAFDVNSSRDFFARDVRCRGTGTNITVAGGSGAAFAFRRCVNSTLMHCVHENGGSLYIQDAVADSTGTGDSIAISGTTCTLTDAAAVFHSGMVGASLSISGCSTIANNGLFQIKTVNTAGTVLTYTNAAGANETSSFKWTTRDGDRKTLLVACHSRNYRASCSVAAFDTTFNGCTWEHDLSTADGAGTGDSFALVATTVTLTDNAAKFKPCHHGRYIKLASSTSAANDGVYGPITYISSTQVSYTNASGVSETFSGMWWIPGGDKVGLGSTLSISGTTVTFTAAASSFAAGDIGKAIYIRNPTSTGNRGAFTIVSVPAANQVTFANTGGVTEAFTGMWTLDGYDNTSDASGNTNGSTHAVYVFAGRENVKFLGCTFEGNRTTGIKVSGSTLPIRDVLIEGCTFRECAVAIIFGADDSNEHTGLTISNCALIDCATNRQAWGGGTQAIGVLGAQGVIIQGVRFHYTRPSIGQVNGVGFSGCKGIEVSRYVIGKSQPVEDVTIDGVTMTVEAGTAAPIFTGVQLNRIGMRAKYGTCTMNRASNIVTVTDSSGLFKASQEVGKTVVLKNTAIDGTYTVLTVPSGTTFTIASAGANGAVAGGTYRMAARTNSTTCRVSRVAVRDAATIGVVCASCVCPTVDDLQVSGVGIALIFTDCRSPYWDNIHEHGRTSLSSSLRVNTGCSWPMAGRTIASNGNLGISSSRNLGISVDNSTAVDYPLLGTHGKAKPTGALEQVVVAYGANLVDGDVLNVNGTNLTYKATAPGAGEFDTFAALLVAIAALGGGGTYTAVDYGSQFADTVTTQHILIAKTAQTTSDGTFYVSSTVLNPTALVVLPNDNSPNTKCYSRGAGSAGPTADKTVIWSPCCDWQRPVAVSANNASARTIAAGGFLKSPNANNSGSCELVQHDTSAGTEEFRWTVS